MLLEQITLENFRQYNGKHEITFSVDKKKNVTLILGENGAGKTTLSQAFLWCLYGITPAFLKKESLLSQKVEDEMHDGGEMRVYVSIKMNHNGKEYEVTRTSSYKKIADKLKDGTVSFSINWTENGEKHFADRKEIENCINEILPEGLSQYFFLSGEKIDDMSFEIKSGKSKTFSNAVNTLLDLDYYKTAIKHLKAIAKEYNTRGVEGFDRRLDEINLKIETDENNIKTFTSILDGDNKKNDELDEKILDYRQRLKSMVSSKELEEQRQKFESALNQKKNSLENELQAAVASFVKKSPYFFAGKVMQSAVKTLDDVSDIDDGDIPDKLHADLIDWIEKRGICVCGEPINEGDKHFLQLEKWRHIVPPESIGTLAKSIRRETVAKFRNGEELCGELKIRRNHIFEVHDKIYDLNSAIDEISEKIANAEDTSDIEKQLRIWQDDRNNTRDTIKKYNQKLAELKQDKQFQEKKRDELLSSNEKGRKVLAWKTMTEKLIEGFERELKEDEEKKRCALISSVKSAFERIYGDTFTVDIDENYNITTSTPLEKSSGQGMSVIFAFLAGLLDVIKQNQSQEKREPTIKLESYPLVLDAPFSVLDTRRISSICNVLPNVSEQIIIFIKDTDGNVVKENLQERIGATYKLVKVNNSDEDTTIVQEEN